MEDDSSYKHSALTELIIGTFYDVYNELGFGFLQSVYRNSLRLALVEKLEIFLFETADGVPLLVPQDHGNHYQVDPCLEDSRFFVSSHFGHRLRGLGLNGCGRRLLWNALGNPKWRDPCSAQYQARQARASPGALRLVNLKHWH